MNVSVSSYYLEMVISYNNSLNIIRLASLFLVLVRYRPSYEVWLLTLLSRFSHGSIYEWSLAYLCIHYYFVALFFVYVKNASYATLHMTNWTEFSNNLFKYKDQIKST